MYLIKKKNICISNLNHNSYAMNNGLFSPLRPPLPRDVNLHLGVDFLQLRLVGNSWQCENCLLVTLFYILSVSTLLSLSLPTCSLHQLFGMDVNGRNAISILMCSELLLLLMFLGLLSEGEHKHDHLLQPTAFLQGTIRCLSHTL